MNYRHAFHAGNFADVFKHALLVRMLVYMMRKEQSLRFIDTHAGIGAYDLSGDEATRTGEWRGGIGRVLKSDPPPEVAELLAPWLAAVGAFNEEGRPSIYPGSPALAQKLLRPQDKIALSELHEHDCHTLRRRLGRDDRLRISQMDGYAALNAWTPPVERRGLVLIDPPFESRDEFERIARAIAKASKKWPTGSYAIWYPLKDEDLVDHFYETLAGLGMTRILRLEMSIDEPAPDGPLTASGLCVINPPFLLIDEARIILAWLAALLGKPGKAGWRADWHAGEESP